MARGGRGRGTDELTEDEKLRRDNEDLRRQVEILTIQLQGRNNEFFADDVDSMDGNPFGGDQTVVRNQRGEQGLWLDIPKFDGSLTAEDFIDSVFQNLGDPVYDDYGDDDENPSFSFTADPLASEASLGSGKSDQQWFVETLNSVPMADAKFDVFFESVPGAQPAVVASPLAARVPSVNVEREIRGGEQVVAADQILSLDVIQRQINELQRTQILGQEQFVYQQKSDGNDCSTRIEDDDKKYKEKGRISFIAVGPSYERKKVRKHLLSWSELRSLVGDDDGAPEDESDPDSRANLLYPGEDDADGLALTQFDSFSSFRVPDVRFSPIIPYFEGNDETVRTP